MSRGFLLLGGIGAGKSAAAAVFARFGALVLSADDFARAVLAPGTTETTAVLERWPDVSDDGQTIDRRRLGRRVFSDGEALAELESITHPATRAALAEAVASYRGEMVAIEMPILRDWFPEWPRVVVDAPNEVRLLRALSRDDGRDEEEIRAMMDRQPSRAEWLAAADFLIDNSGDLQDLEDECRRVWEELVGD